MATISALASIAIIVVSLLAGFLAFYLISDLSKMEKKKQIGELTSQLMNFVIFIWLGKILLNFSIFVRDPLAILAYPSNSSAFYLALFFSAVTIAIKSKREQLDVLSLGKSFIYVFLIGSFVYEFIQIVWNNDTYSVSSMILLAVLIIFFLFMRERVTTDLLLIIMVIGWTAGTLALAYIMPFTMVFGFTMAPWFLVLFLIVFLTLMMLKKRKKVL
ncbi:hypothetical protein RJD24_07820 [Bacillaceae bacterium IKA-2]|nr:hypothetical protein RJD24_07820 [Bacillaceae bacterium IKA-2]